MALPETDVAWVERWCQARVPAAVRDQVRVEADVTERQVTIVECRPPWRADLGPEWTRFLIARLRYTKKIVLAGQTRTPDPQHCVQVLPWSGPDY